MKILCTEYNEAGEAAIVPMGDDVLLRNNGDFYIPDYSREISCVPQLVIRLCKLGKCVSERFAGRYFEEIGVGVRFYADDFAEQLRAKSLPEVMASSFDASAAISSLVAVGEHNPCNYAMRVNGEPMWQSNREALSLSLERIVALSSEFHTLKIGDFVYCGGSFRYSGVKAGDRIQMELNGKIMLDFEVK